MDNILPIFKALSDETRLRILSLMKDREICVCDIAETLGMTQPNISFHLSLLKEAGLIKDRKNGRWIHYSLDESDMFTRFLLMGIFERMRGKPPEIIKKSRKC
ncbi:MAG TPA: ArsR family transcriptional regulator [Nitrospiraceae bacterium]|nr:ArsR family transcriptional regulator [Nitrospiraceae bacterium]